MEKINIFNTKINQAYVNQEYQYNILIQKINALEEKNNKLSEQVLELIKDQENNKNIINNLQQELNQISNEFTDYKNQVNDYLDHLDDSLDENDILFKNLSEENQILLQGLMRMKQEFDLYVESSFKEKIFSAASLTVLSIELLQNNIIDNEQYIIKLNTIIKQIIDVYKEEGIDINFDDLLNDNNTDSSAGISLSTEIPLSTIKSMKKNIYKNKRKVKQDENVINLNDILKKKKDPVIKVKTESHESNTNSLFHLFNNNLISELDKEKELKKTNSKKKKDNKPK